ncbi:MAG: hypothetical protein VKP62_03110 [Candidatus Sericytochromatia bacterium]|nr:hypothetical protein [Candidatus Sericytochromatia bacterium]
MSNQRHLHRLIGLVSSPLILLAACTTLGLNHKDWLQGRLAPPLPATTPHQRYILSSTVNPANARQLFVGTNDGLFVSPDGGKHWENLPMPVKAVQVSSLLFTTRPTRTLWVVLRDRGVWRSVDDGAHWAPVPLPAGQPAVASLALNADGGMVLVSARGTWVQARPGGPFMTHRAHENPEDREGKRRLQLFYDLHDGQYWRDFGVPITDGVAIALIALVATGYGLALQAAWRKRQRRIRGRWRGKLALKAESAPTRGG